MTRRGVIFLVPMILFVGVAAYFLEALLKGEDPRQLPSMLIGKPTPAFSLPPLLDNVPSLADDDLKGHVTLVNFFASWCVPCRIEHPFLMRLAQIDGLQLAGIAYKDKPEATKALLEELGNPYDRIAQDSSGRTGIDFGITGVPETFVIGKDGLVYFRQWGPISESALEEDLLPLIEKLQQ